ncbi:MAG TPA: hypothetical protein ENO18_04615 [Caldithrix sp.]|nr:hypothetical protein [Caldithrix sp.]
MESKVISLYQSGKSAYEIAKHLDTYPVKIYRILNKNNISIRQIEPANKLKIPLSLQKSIIELYDKGYSKQQITKKLSVSEWAIRLSVPKFRSLSDASKLVHSKRGIILTESQKQCILGTLLGDASLTKHKQQYWVYQVTHSIKQKEYAVHIQNKLNGRFTEYECKNAYSTRKCKVRFQNKMALEKLVTITLMKGIKTINKKWMEEINLEGLAYWFMDDGSSSYVKNRKWAFVRFSTLSFDLKEIELLAAKLKLYGIDSTKVKSKYGKGTIMSLPKNSSVKFLQLTKQYAAKGMEYKWKLPKG